MAAAAVAPMVGSDSPCCAFAVGPLSCFFTCDPAPAERADGDDESRGLLADSPGVDGTARRASIREGGPCPSCGGQEFIELEHDTYAIAGVPNIGVLPAVLCPFTSALVQTSVLYSFALTNDFVFEEQWLEPKSRSGRVNFMKCVGLCMVLFKVSTELEHALRLCTALLVGKFVAWHAPYSGWWAVGLQYSMSMSVLFVAVSVVIGAQSSSSCVLKIFSVFVVIDLDNLAARFLESLLWLDFRVPVQTQNRLAGPPWYQKYTCWQMRACFTSFPVLCVLLMSVAALRMNTIPLTYVRYGAVSNLHPPMLTNSHGCCPPALEVHGGDSANYSAFVLSAFDVPAPVVYWVALEATRPPPSALQVLEGYDGDNNYAFRAGSAVASRIQAAYWLERHGFGVKVYQAIRDAEQLDTRTVPHAASFKVNNLELFGRDYYVYVAAQNPKTLALSASVLRSSRFVTTVCAELCATCERAGPGKCDFCENGTVMDEEGMCRRCPTNCLRCEAPDSCIKGGCVGGYGVNEVGGCDRCEIPNCRTCFHNTSSCNMCDCGFGVSGNGTCVQCRHDRCSCWENGECYSCEAGWGLTWNGTCKQCDEGCLECDFADTRLCKSCKEGYGQVGPGVCQRCTHYCKNCTSGIGACDECRPGFGFLPGLGRGPGSCELCDIQHCDGCAFDDTGAARCTRCSRGFVVTHGGACDTCGDHCAHCGSESCLECHPGYAPKDGRCYSCADRCMDCSRAGPARCDRCLPGFVLDGEAAICARKASALRPLSRDVVEI